jgi:hypothetical protein
MSKPIARVAIFLLISLTLIAATYMTVQGAWGKTGTTSAVMGAQVQSHSAGGLQTNLDHDRLSSAEVQSAQSQLKNYANPVDDTHMNGGCHSEQHQSSQD